MMNEILLTREIIKRQERGLIYGYHEHSRDDGASWYTGPWDQWVRMDPDHHDARGKLWFSDSAHTIIQSHIGIQTTPERARNFEDAIDGHADMWYYLSVATDPSAGDEALKWILGALAAEVKIRKMAFYQIPEILSSTMLRLFTTALLDGRINRTFSKQIFAELLLSRTGYGEEEEYLKQIIDDPRFKAVDDTALESLVNKVIDDNPDQFSKACENPKLVQWFVGQIMKASQGKASAPKIIELVNARIVNPT